MGVFSLHFKMSNILVLLLIRCAIRRFVSGISNILSTHFCVVYAVANVLQDMLQRETCNFQHCPIARQLEDWRLW